MSSSVSRRAWLLATGAAGATLIGGPGVAQSTTPSTAPAAAAWPTRPVRLLVGFPAGSTPDLTARVLADGLTRTLGQPVRVENRPGASGNIAADAVAKADDDHTLGVVINGNLTSAKMLNPKLPFDPSRDFALLSLLTTAPLVLVAPASQPEGAAFFESARAGGNRWNYGSVGIGSVGHLGMEVLKAAAGGLQAQHVPYNGNPAVLTAITAGEIQMALVPPGLALPQARAGRLRAIGVTGGRSTLAPELPTLTSLGVALGDLEVWNALVGPASLSAAARARLAREVPEAIRSAEGRQRLFAAGWQAQGTAPEGLVLRARREAEVLGQIIRTQNIRVE